MDNLFLDEFDTPVDPQQIKEIQIHDKNNVFNMNIDNNEHIDEYSNLDENINTETIIHKQDNISDDTNHNKIYDISSLFLKPITYHNILISNIEHNTIDKASNKMIYHLSETYSTSRIFKNVVGFRLSEFIMSMPLKNIQEDMFLYSDEDLNNKLVTVEKGYYTLNQLVNNISGQISASGTFNYNTTKRIVDYKLISPGFNLYQNEDGLLTLLGFNKQQGEDKVFLSKSITASHHPNLLIGSYLDVVIDEIPIESCKRTCSGKYILARIPLTTDSSDNDIIYYNNKQFNCNYEANNLFYPINISKLTLSLYLDNKDFNYDNIDYSFEFELTILNR
jgi:hypothetical protein